jgi:hypothetical protein
VPFRTEAGWLGAVRDHMRKAIASAQHVETIPCMQRTAPGGATLALKAGKNVAAAGLPRLDRENAGGREADEANDSQPLETGSARGRGFRASTSRLTVWCLEPFQLGQVGDTARQIGDAL